MITPDLGFWLRPIALIAVEVTVVFAVAFLAHLFVRSVFWRKTIWQICIAGTLLVVAIELTGFGRGVALWLAREKPQQRQVIARVLPDNSQRAPVLEAQAESNAPAAIEERAGPKSVWWPAVVLLCGAGIILARILFARVALFVLCRNAVKAPSCLSERVAEIALRFRFSRCIRLVLSRAVKSPIAFGVLRPSLGLPMDFEKRFNASQRDVMLVHEIAHLAGRDPVWYLIADFATALLWWHPMIWVARRRLHIASELAADEATSELENGPSTLAECLVNLGRQLTDQRSLGWLGIRGSFRSALGQRVERLLALRQPPSRPRWWAVLLAKSGLTVLVAAVVAFVAGAVQTGGAVHETDFKTSIERAWQQSPLGTAVAMKASSDPVESPKSKDAGAASSRIAQAANSEVRYHGDFKLNLDAFKNALEAQGFFVDSKSGYEDDGVRVNRTWTVRPLLKDFFVANGIPAPDAITVNPTDGISSVTGTLESFEAIERFLNEQRLASGGGVITTISPQDIFAAKSPLAWKRPANVPVAKTLGADDLVQVGKTLFQLRQYESARTQFEQALAQAPDDKIARYYLTLLDDKDRLSELTSKYRRNDSQAASENDLYYLTNPKKVAARLAPFTENQNRPSPPMLGTDSGLFPAKTVRVAEANISPAASEASAVQNNAATKIQPTNAAAPANDRMLGTSPQRRVILSKLKQIKIAEVQFDQSPLSHVARFLVDESRKVDSEAGIACMLQPADMDQITVTIHPALKNLTLADTLDAIVTAASKPIRYEVRDYAVVFMKQSEDELKTRSYKVDPNAVLEALAKFDSTVATQGETVDSAKSAPIIIDSPVRATDPPYYGTRNGVTFVTKTNLLKSLNDCLRNYFKVAGAELAPPKSVFFNDRNGTILVRATPKDFEVIDTAIAALNSPAPQVTIEVKFADVDERTAKQLGFDWLLPTNIVAGSAMRTSAQPTVAINSTIVPNATLTNVSGILTEPEFRKLVQKLEKQPGVDLLTSPKVTTLSGRQAQVSVLDIRTVVTGVATTTTTNGISTNTVQTAQIPCGPTLDVIPHVSADGFSIQMTIIATVNEFLGYDEPDKKVKAMARKTQVPLPRMRVRQAMTVATVFDRQTIVLGGMASENVVKIVDNVAVLSRIPLVGRLFRTESTGTEKRHLLVFITPTLIDSVGNATHTAEELEKVARKQK